MSCFLVSQRPNVIFKMNKCVIPFLLISVRYAADSLSIDSTFNGEQLGCGYFGGNKFCNDKGPDWICKNDDKLVWKYKCECKNGYQPKKDNIEECEKQMGCEHLGGNTFCNDKGSDWICKNGDNLEKKYKCECKTGYQPMKDNADECEKQMGCEHLGGNTSCNDKGSNWICINDDNLEKKFKCECEPGYQPNADECERLPTTPEEFSTRFKYLTFTFGELSTRFKYSTTIQEELSTRFKYSTTIPEKRSTRFKSICDEDKNDCVNGGECIQLGNQHFCHCLRGTYGDKCQHMWDCDERYNLKCNYRNGEICAYNTTLEESECLCAERLYYDTESGMCRETCIVENHDCENGAICKSVGNYAFCECRPGTFGHKCERVRDCDFMNCANTTGGRCEYDSNLEIAKCVCDYGLKYDSYANECRETCVVKNHDCENGAICKTVGRYSFCKCRPGTFGHKCERVRDCDFMNCTETTGGWCEYDRNFKIAKCVCDYGLKYDNYTHECRETCNPQKNDCQNEALCQKEGNYSFCRCIPGSHGHKCEIVNDCESQKVTCNENNGARCGITMDFRRVGCVCEYGLKYDEESLACRETCYFYENKCENGAHCNLIGHYYFCDCLPGFSGHRCEQFKDKREYSPILLIILCTISGFLLMSIITLVTVFLKFRSRRCKE